jgi:hypothetical protein
MTKQVTYESGIKRIVDKLVKTVIRDYRKINCKLGATECRAHKNCVI